MIYKDIKKIESVAVMANNNEYRFRLTRTWDSTKKIVGVLMLNPSKANSLKTDNTIMNLTNYLIDKNYGGVDIVNMYAFMATKPSELVHRNLAYESLNNDYILQVATEREILMIAWGSDVNKYVNRKKEIEQLLSPYVGKLRCFEDPSGKSPRHPLHLSSTWGLVPYNFRYIL